MENKQCCKLCICRDESLREEFCCGKTCPCHQKEEKHGKNLCKTYHPDDCCTENPKCGFYEPKQEEKCKCGGKGFILTTKPDFEQNVLEGEWN